MLTQIEKLFFDLKQSFEKYTKPKECSFVLPSLYLKVLELEIIQTVSPYIGNSSGKFWTSVLKSPEKDGVWGKQ